MFTLVFIIKTSYEFELIDKLKDKVKNKTIEAYNRVDLKLKTKLIKLKENLGLFKNETELCYDELGCFNNTKPWYSFLRPLPLPMEPEKINTSITLYNTRQDIELWPNIKILNFNVSKPYTVFIFHGFASNGNSSWVKQLAKAYLKKRDANIFIVDWGQGASHINYLQVASNTRIVGAEVTRFVKYLINEKNLTLDKVHLIGHSLGAHICGYISKQLNNFRKIDQITALDPAQPAFEGFPENVRLDKEDANFVDVLHTNTRPTIPLLGFGYQDVLGHNDYYFNGGLIQPGCKTPSPDILKIKSLSDFLKITVETISEWVSCSHGRSYKYYIESLENDYCKFWGRQSGYLLKKLQTFTLGLSEEKIQKLSPCNLEKCSYIGLNSRNLPLRGIFLISTHSNSPFCNSNPNL